jgi:hypothetical protein
MIDSANPSRKTIRRKYPELPPSKALSHISHEKEIGSV